MKLQIIGILDRGVVNKERLFLKVAQDTNLSYYIALLSQHVDLTGAGISDGHRQAFWFPSRPARAGDQIVLYSGPGFPTTRVEPTGATTYFFYWGLPQTVWNNSLSCAVLVEAATWATTRVGG